MPEKIQTKSGRVVEDMACLSLKQCTDEFLSEKEQSYKNLNLNVYCPGKSAMMLSFDVFLSASHQQNDWNIF